MGKASRWVVAAVVGTLVLLVGIPLGGVMLLAALLSSTSSQPEAASGACVTDPSVVYASSGEARLPVVGSYTYTSPYGMRLHPIYNVMRLHAGMDLVSNGDIVAPQKARVQSVTMNDPGAGNFVVLNHGGGITSRYLHLASVSVASGQEVEMGQKLGVEGTTGGSTGVHLHFEILKDGQSTDPAQWLTQHGVKVPPVGGTGTAPATSEKPSSSGGDDAEPVQVSGDGGGSGFSLPKPGTERRNSVSTPAMSIPPAHQKAYEAAGRKYGIPWQLLAGVGMEETHHWRIQAVSSAGAMGPMQFTPPTWIDYGVDGDGDGSADILDVEDAIHSAANMLAKNGATTDADGVRAAVRRYNNAEWYVNDVLYYAWQYGKGEISVQPVGDDCGKLDASMDSAATTECPASKSPAEKGLQPVALNGLRCGAAAAPWVETIYGVGQRSGATDHDDGLAVDFMIPDHKSKAGRERGWDLARWFERNAGRLSVTYLIYDGKIWSTARANEGWRPYTRYGNTPNDTLAHRDHVHVSFETAQGPAA